MGRDGKWPTHIWEFKFIRSAIGSMVYIRYAIADAIGTLSEAPKYVNV